MEALIKDVRYALRTLRDRPVFTLVAVITLALGIGANSAIFSVVSTVLLNPLPYREPDRLVVALYGGGQSSSNPVSPTEFRDWQEQSSVFEQMAAASLWGPNMTGRDQPEQIRGLQATGNLFDMLGVEAALGRGFTVEDDKAGAEPVVVLSDQLWKRRFGSDPSIIGQTLTLDGRSYTVIGVMSPSFQFPFFWATRTELWTPSQLSNGEFTRRARFLRVFARLKPDVTVAQAQAEMDAISARLTEQYPDTNTGLRAVVTPLHERITGQYRSTLLVLLGAVGFVLLIACTNVANLLLARASAREREIAVRLALGATRARLIRQLLTESVMLAIIGGAAGLALAFWSVRALVAGLPADALPRQQGIGVDAGVFAFTLILCLLTGIVFGLVPAIHSSKTDLNESLKSGGKNAAGDSRGRSMRSGLVVAELALALMLLVGAGLMTRSFIRLQSIDPGFNAQNLLTMTISVAGTGHAPASQRAQFFQQALERIEALPGVRSASFVNHLPLGGDRWGTQFTIEGMSAPAPGQTPGTAFRVAHSGYMETMGIQMIAGRDFNERDTLDAPGVIIINEAIANKFWPGEDPLGKRIKLGDIEAQIPWLSIIGVVRQVKQEDWAEEGRNEIYIPYLQARLYLTSPQAHNQYLTLVAKTDSDANNLASAIRREVWAIEPNAPISSVATMEEVIANEVWQPRLSMFLLGGFAVVALLLAAIGIYGVMSYSVTRRIQEIGVRMALGASQGDILKLVVSQGLKLSLIGIAIGLGAAFALSRLLEGLLYQVSPTDPVTFALVAFVLGAVAFASCYLPARRAAKVDPQVALRYE
jgi:putative ABC transport system permease protein